MPARGSWTDEDVATLNDAGLLIALAGAPGFERLVPLKQRWATAASAFALAVDGGALKPLPVARRQLKALAARICRTKVDWRAAAAAVAQRRRSA